MVIGLVSVREMDTHVFEKFRNIVYEKSGIFLREGKESLVCARVGKRMRDLELDEHRDYLEYLTKDQTGEEMVHLLDAISTNVTSFFREPNHFDFLGEVVSRWIAQGQSRFRFWSAACSSGEEPYSMAMALAETLQTAGSPVDVKILATDISTRMLEKSRQGTYDEERIKTVPAALRGRYLERHRDNGSYAVKETLRRLIVFKRLNLSDPPFPLTGPLDIVFCRNVMIYFDNTVRKRLLDELHRLLKPGGYLMVGHAESLTGLLSDFKIVCPSIYIKH